MSLAHITLQYMRIHQRRKAPNHEPGLAILLSRYRETAQERLGLICEQTRGHLDSLVPGECSVAVRRIVDHQTLKSEQEYLVPLREKFGGDIDQLQAHVKMTAPSDREAAAIRLACDARAVHSRPNLLPFCYIDTCTAYKVFFPPDKNAHIPPLYYPDYDHANGKSPPSGSAAPPYQDPTHEYWRYYRSVLSIPLWRYRRHPRNVWAHIKVPVGFLCIDSTAPLAFSGLIRMPDRENPGSWSPLVHTLFGVADSSAAILASIRLVESMSRAMKQAH